MNKAYVIYKQRMEQRIKTGEAIKVKPRNEWQKTIEKNVDGKTVKTIVCGESGETSQEKAKRLGTSRMKKVLSAMKGLKILATSSQYKFTDEQVKYITSKINDAALDVISSFEGKSPETKEIIVLPS